MPEILGKQVGKIGFGLMGKLPTYLPNTYILNALAI